MDLRLRGDDGDSMNDTLEVPGKPIPGDIDIANYMVNFGPQHPAAHGVLSMVLEMDGEIVERVDPHLGLRSRGTEKQIEYKTYFQRLPDFEQLDDGSPICLEHTYMQPNEKLMALEVPLRA